MNMKKSPATWKAKRRQARLGIASRVATSIHFFAFSFARGSSPFLSELEVRLKDPHLAVMKGESEQEKKKGTQKRCIT